MPALFPSRVGAFELQAVEVVSAQVFVLQVVFEQMVDDDQDRMPPANGCGNFPWWAEKSFIDPQIDIRASNP